MLPLKLFKDEKKKYFSFVVHNENKLYRDLCFSPEKRCFSEKTANDDSNSGINLNILNFETKTMTT